MNTVQAPVPRRLVEGEGSPQENTVGEALRAFRASTNSTPSSASQTQVLHAMRKEASRRRWLRGTSTVSIAAIILTALFWGLSRNEKSEAAIHPQAATSQPATEAAVATVDSPSILSEPKPAPAMPSGATLKLGNAKSRKLRPTDEADALLEESRLLMKVSSAMKAQDFPHALELLNEYSLRFPEGTLRVEAATSRAKVYLVQEQFDEARQVVEQLKPLLGASSRGNELQLFEAELWAARSRCAEALGILEKLNSAGLSAQERERELWVKSNCQLKLGKKEEGLRHLHRYLPEFPQGQFSAQAEALLGTLK